MKTILQLNASILSDNGQSTRLANEFVAALLKDEPETKLTLRDFETRDPVPHLMRNGSAPFSETRSPHAEAGTRSSITRMA